MYKKILLLIYFTPFFLNGGSSSQNFNVVINVSPSTLLEFPPANISIPSPTAVDLDKGYIIIPEAITIKVSSNKKWTLYVKTIENHLGGENKKPLSDFLLKTEGGRRKSRGGKQRYQAISNRFMPLISSNQGAQELKCPIDLKVLTSWDNTPPGSYDITLIFSMEEI